MKRIDFFLNFLFLPLAVLAVFWFLVIFPSLVAIGAIQRTPVSIIFAIFLYLQFWMIITQVLLDLISDIYKVKRRTVLPTRHILPVKKTIKYPIFKTFVMVIISFLGAVYGFALFFVFFSHLNPSSFNVRSLTLFDGFYFSFLTATTVSFGDIIPVSTLIKSAAMLEVLIFFLYAGLVISVVPDIVRSKIRIE